MTARLRIAVQKKGRLADSSYNLLKQAGLKFSVRGDGLLTRVRNMPVDLLLVRDDDIPSFVASGAADLGIVGGNVLEEELLTNTDVGNIEVAMPLGYSKCRLCLAASASSGIRTPEDLEGKRVATTYPGILKRYLSNLGIAAGVVEMKGAVELAPSIGVADAICDLVSSGATLQANGLAAFETVLESEAVLIKQDTEIGAYLKVIYDRLLSRMEGVIRSTETKYIMLNAPKSQLDAISEILPGSDSPTIMPLAGSDDYVAIHAVCTETVFWETLEALKASGAKSILVLPIEKMMI